MIWHRRATLSASQQQRLALLLVALHLVLGLIYSVATPAWEAFDERGHYIYARYLAIHRALPRPSEPLVPSVGATQSTQPPLYYILAAFPIMFVDTSDDAEPALNRYATHGKGEVGVNMVIHDFAVEGFPYRGTFLALHLARLVSVLLSGIGVWFVFLLGRWLLPERPTISLAATAIVAFAPQYLFIGAVVTNDILIAVLACATLYYACRIALSSPRPADLAGLGISLGLALITKHTAIGLVLITAGALILAGVREIRQRTLHRSLWWGGAVLLAVLILDGWWIGRNVAHYGSPISRDIGTIQLFIEGMRAPAEFLAGIPWNKVPGALWYGFQTFWGNFGWGNVGLPMWIYYTLTSISVISLVGCVAALVRRDTPAKLKGAILFLGFSVLVLVILPFLREVVRGAPSLSGRFLLLTMPAVGMYLSVGLLWWLPTVWRRPAALLVVAAFFAFGALTPFVVIAPAYAPPARPTSAQLPADAHPLQVRFGDYAELYGYQIWPATVRQGRAVGVTLYWRALAEMKENYSVGVYALGAEGQPYGQVIRYPGRGNFATSLWKPGDLLVETYWIPILSDRPAPCRGQIAVSLFLDTPKQPIYLAVTDGAGKPLGESAIFGRFKIAPAQSTQVEFLPALAKFGGQIALVDVDVPAQTEAGHTIKIGARFQALDRPAADYILFVHLINERGERVTGVDGPPLLGNYPTGLWDAGESFVEERRLALPRELGAGNYRLALGWYRLEDGGRLPAIGASGKTLPAGAWLSDPILVETPLRRVVLPFLVRQAPSKR